MAKYTLPITDTDAANFAERLTEWLGGDATISIMPGVRYIRLVRSGSAYGFIERTTGLLYKTDGWKKPAKHPRGDINDPKFGGCGPYGMAYLR